MVFRCSILAAGLALLGICAPLTTSVRAGDRIEFSSPLVPLAIPQPEADTRQREPVKLFRGPTTSGNMMGGEFVPSGEVTFMRTRKTEKDPWNKDPWDKDQWNTDPFKDKEDMFSGLPPQQNPENAATNMLSILGVMQRDPDSQPQDAILLHRDGDSQNDQNEQNGQNDSRFDQANTSSDQPDRSGLFGRDPSQDSGISSFFGSLTRGPASASRFNAGSFVTGDHQSANLTGDTAPAWQFGQGPQADDPNRFALPTGFANFRPTDPQTSGDSTGAASSYIHAWDDEAANHSASTESPARSRFLSEQINAARVTAPNRPANLPWVKRPGDPF